VITARKLLIRDIQTFILYILGIGVFGMGIFFILPLGRYQTFFNLAQDSSLSARIELWPIVLEIISESILLGHGPGKQGLLEYNLTTADNGLLQWWYHYGFLGLVFFISLLFDAITYSLEAITNEIKTDPLIYPFTISVLVYTITIPLMWQFMPVAQNRRAFTIYLVCIVILISYVYNFKTITID
jgi:O-antigen ligase